MANFNWPVTPTTLTTSPIQFVDNGIDTEVSIDTATPANSRPLPTKVLDAAGNIVDFATEATLGFVNINTEASSIYLGEAASGVNPFKVDVTSSVLPTGAATQTTLASLLSKTAGTPVNFAYDEVALTYVAAGNGVGEIATVVWKLATVTQKTATFTYNVSNKLTGVVWS